MQIGAKWKICSSLLLLPQVPCWGFFKRLCSSEAKEERGDTWSHAFLQRFLRTVLVETPSAHPCCGGQVSLHDFLLLKAFLPAPDSLGMFLWGLACTWPSGEMFLTQLAQNNPRHAYQKDSLSAAQQYARASVLTRQCPPVEGLLIVENQLHPRSEKTGSEPSSIQHTCVSASKVYFKEPWDFFHMGSSGKCLVGIELGCRI